MKTAISANGLSGLLIWTGENYLFRVHSSPGEFKDYSIVHSDLSVTINDVDAFIYSYPDNVNHDGCIDHSPETLGLSEWKRDAIEEN